MRRSALVGESLGVGKDEEDEGFTEISSQIPRYKLTLKDP